MASRHVVRRGECLSLIARQHGFSDYKTLYDHPDNADLKKARPNPNVLFPGDVVHIPDKEMKDVSAPTGQVHTFKLVMPRKVLRIVFKNHEGQPLAGAEYRLEIGDQADDDDVVEGTTDGDGLLEENIVARVSEAFLHIEGRVLRLNLGGLNPIGDLDANDASGVQARLANLGYDVGPVDGIAGRRTRHALAVFQVEQGLDVDGEPTKATLDKLVEVHGC